LEGKGEDGLSVKKRCLFDLQHFPFRADVDPPDFAFLGASPRLYLFSIFITKLDGVTEARVWRHDPYDTRVPGNEARTRLYLLVWRAKAK
jgi:hypothetical protein